QLVSIPTWCARFITDTALTLAQTASEVAFGHTSASSWKVAVSSSWPRYKQLSRRPLEAGLAS
nr:hypothetical protein [Tanacetum cinerariifolium]